MAAIDKMYLGDYFIFDKFRLWCIVHKPTLLYHFYNWNMNEKEWDDWKEQCYRVRFTPKELIGCAFSFSVYSDKPVSISYIGVAYDKVSDTVGVK